MKLVSSLFVLATKVFFANAQQPTCPSDWDQVGPFLADIAGCGLEACNERYDKLDIEECASHCCNHPQCKSFTWAPMDGDKNHPGERVCTIYQFDVDNRLWATNQIMCKPGPQVVCPPSPSVSGDPHFKTWSGRKFDFHGVCDLVLLQNPGFQEGVGMDIHLQTKELKEFSYVSSAVLRIGEDTLEVKGDIKENLYWINKQANTNLDKGINGHPIMYRKVNSKQHEFTVDLGANATITMKTFKKFVRVSIEGATKKDFETSRGLLGKYGSGDMISRDDSTVLEDTDAFGQEWQVVPADGTLFHNVDGPQSPEKCQIPFASSLRRRLAESEIREEQAEIACARVNPEDFDACVFDVMATGDKDVTGAY